MTARHLDVVEFKRTAKEGALPEEVMLHKSFNSEVRAIEAGAGEDSADRILEFIISTDSVDRHGDTVSVKGWDLKQYKQNPVILFGHDYSQPPIGKSLKTVVETISSKAGDAPTRALVARAQFMEADLNPFADMIFRMYKEGYMKATSVGFNPTKWKWVDTDEEGNADRDPWGIDFEKQELLEFSAVPVPANADALLRAKGAGINVALLKNWAEQVLDNQTTEAGLWVPRDAVESLYKQVSEMKQTHKRQQLNISLEDDQSEKAADPDTEVDAGAATLEIEAVVDAEAAVAAIEAELAAGKEEVLELKASLETSVERIEELGKTIKSLVARVEDMETVVTSFTPPVEVSDSKEQSDDEGESLEKFLEGIDEGELATLVSGAVTEKVHSIVGGHISTDER